MKFEWDDEKNIINIKKHGISFTEAVYVFSDLNALSIYDEQHSLDEERYITIGKVKKNDIIVVVHTERIKKTEEYIRLISARKAVKSEINEYVRQLGGV